MQVLCLCSPFGGRGPILLSLNFCFQDGSYVSYETRKIWHYIPEESLPLETMVRCTLSDLLLATHIIGICYSLYLTLKRLILR